MSYLLIDIYRNIILSQGGIYMGVYRIPIHYDPSHYRDLIAEGKDVGAWMTASLGEVLASYGLQSDDPGHFRDITDQQEENPDCIFTGQIPGTDGKSTHIVSIKGTEPRELTVSLDPNGLGSASEDDILEGFYKVIENAYFTRTGEQFEKTESVSRGISAGQGSSANQTEAADQGPSDQGTGKAGCYIATAVYGSYDCPEVWTLRRFRDDRLLQTAAGRLFVKLYYAISPAVVERFGDTVWFNRFWKGRLNKLVHKLREDGYQDTPYYDR